MDTGVQKCSLCCGPGRKIPSLSHLPYPQEMPVVSSAQVLDSCSETPGIPWDEFGGGIVCVFLKNKVRNSLSSRGKGHIP